MRIDFIQLCGLSLSEAIPDKTTLCRFRNRLVANDRLDVLLASINEQIHSHGLMAKGATWLEKQEIADLVGDVLDGYVLGAHTAPASPEAK